MIARTLLSWAAALHRFVTGRRARRCYLALLILVVAYSGAVLFRSFVLARRFQAVVSRLKQIQVDVSSEEQLRKTVPYLVRYGHESRQGSSVKRHYRVAISNEGDRWISWLPWFLNSIWPGRGSVGLAADHISDKWGALGLPDKVAYLLGCRHVAFRASVSVLDGTVSQIWYDIEPDIFLGWPRSEFVVVHSAHGFWRRSRDLPVSSTDDESPEYRFGFSGGAFSMFPGPDSSIGVAYTPDAPPELISHVFQVDLSCFWNLRGCGSVSEVAPLLWHDRQAILEAADARLKYQDPCPDRILAGRVRYLPDLDVALLEVVNSRYEDVNHEGDISQETVTDYRLKEVIRGHPEGPWTGIRYRRAIPWPASPGGAIANPVGLSFPKAGDRFLYFGGAGLILAGSFRPRLQPRKQSEQQSPWQKGAKMTSRGWGVDCESVGARC